MASCAVVSVSRPMAAAQRQSCAVPATSSRAVSAMRPAAAAPRRVSRAVPAVVTRAAGAPEYIAPTIKDGKAHWYALVASAEFFFNDVQNEPFAEQLREKKRFYDEQGKPADFFLACEPAWLEKRFPDKAARCRRPAVALLCPDKMWMTFMKVRLDRVMFLDLGEMTVDEACKSTQEVPKLKPQENWIAPYAPYAWGWWEVFMRK